MSKPVKPLKQVTFDSIPATTATKQDPNTKSTIQKQICITEIKTTTKIDELILKINFKLEPTYQAFSKVKADLFFENTPISTTLIRVPQGPLGTNNLEYKWTIDTKGIAEGTYHLKIEIYEVWSSGEKLCQTTREITVKYVPQTRVMPQNS
ncbi:MAG: hypothetical protein LBC03_06435 [Nitrososphaerota archaeon]|jgi:hypothetical protein|nr:hypothetical protein [Nitrososphaerota archaeon]